MSLLSWGNHFFPYLNETTRASNFLKTLCTRKKNLWTNRRHMSTATSLQSSFYKRELPSHLISFSSLQGRQIFQESLIQGGVGSTYFSLAEQFTTQSEPAYCGLATLSMVLNSLELDPQRIWKGPWRWFDEKNVICTAGTCTKCLISKDHAIHHGITMSEFLQIARCNKAFVVDSRESANQELNAFRRQLVAVTHGDGVRMVVSFSRSVLGQTGEGHFSPIAAYNKEKDLVLILDVARFKYPPFWVPVDKLWTAMQTKDSVTQEPRGYCLLSNVPICTAVSHPTWGTVINSISYHRDILQKSIVHFLNILPSRMDHCWRSFMNALATQLSPADRYKMRKQLQQTPLHCLIEDIPLQRQLAKSDWDIFKVYGQDAPTIASMILLASAEDNNCKLPQAVRLVCWSACLPQLLKNGVALLQKEMQLQSLVD